MFLLAHKYATTESLGEPRKDGASPSFRPMDKLPDEEIALLHEQYWGGVQQTNSVIF
jgi:hypothetical protein